MSPRLAQLVSPKGQFQLHSWKHHSPTFCWQHSACSIITPLLMLKSPIWKYIHRQVAIPQHQLPTRTYASPLAFPKLAYLKCGVGAGMAPKASPYLQYAIYSQYNLELTYYQLIDLIPLSASHHVIHNLCGLCNGTILKMWRQAIPLLLGRGTFFHSCQKGFSQTQLQPSQCHLGPHLLDFRPFGHAICWIYPSWHMLCMGPVTPPLFSLPRVLN